MTKPTGLAASDKIEAASAVPLDSSFAAPKLSFSIDHKGEKSNITTSTGINKARTGKLSFATTSTNEKDTPSGHTIATPAIINYTKKGSPLHLSRDNVDRLPIEMVMLAFEHFLEYNPPSYLSAPYGLKRYLGLRQKAAPVIQAQSVDAQDISSSIASQKTLPPHILFANLRDVADQMDIPSIVEGFIPCRTFRGIRKMIPARYLDTAFPRPPDVLLALADEPLGHANSQKRLTKSLVRSEAWLKSCIARNSEIRMTNLFAPLVGGTNAMARKTYAQTLAQELQADDVAGYSINLNAIRPQDLSGTDEMRRSEQDSSELLNASLANIDASKPRLALCPGGPHEVLELVSTHGLDLFMDEWSTALSSVGIALDFKLGGSAEEQALDAQTQQTLGISLFDSKYARDFTPLASPATMELLKSRYGSEALGDLPTKAYLYHLLHAHEMTSHVLLAMHNTCVMDLFMASIRDAIREGKLQKYKALFDKTYTRKLQAWEEANAHWAQVNSERGKGRLKGLGQERRSEGADAPVGEQERMSFQDVNLETA